MTVLGWPCEVDGHVLYIDRPLRVPIDAQVRHCVKALLRRGERDVVLDLTGVTNIDAAGVGELVRAHNMARAVNGTVHVVNATAWVRQLIERAGLGELLLTDRMLVCSIAF